MLSAFIYILIIGCSTLAGFLYAENIKKRVSELNEIERSVIQLQNEIIYTYTPLPEAIKNVSEKSSSPMKQIYEYIYMELLSNKVQSVYDAFEDAFKKYNDYISLKKEDKAILLDMSKTLGESDIEGHRRIFELTICNLKKQIAIAEALMHKDVKMYRYLGFTIGSVIVIMLI